MFFKANHSYRKFQSFLFCHNTCREITEVFIFDRSHFNQLFFLCLKVVVLLNKTAKRSLERPVSLVQPILHYLIHALRWLSPMNTLFFHLERPRNTWRAILSFLFTPHIVTLEEAAWKGSVEDIEIKELFQNVFTFNRTQMLRPLVTTLVNKLHRTMNSGNIITCKAFWNFRQFVHRSDLFADSA